MLFYFLRIVKGLTSCRARLESGKNTFHVCVLPSDPQHIDSPHRVHHSSFNTNISYSYSKWFACNFVFSTRSANDHAICLHFRASTSHRTTKFLFPNMFQTAPMFFLLSPNPLIIISMFCWTQTWKEIRWCLWFPGVQKPRVQQSIAFFRHRILLHISHNNDKLIPCWLFQGNTDLAEYVRVFYKIDVIWPDVHFLASSLVASALDINPPFALHLFFTTCLFCSSKRLQKYVACFRATFLPVLGHLEIQ